MTALNLHSGNLCGGFTITYKGYGSY